MTLEQFFLQNPRLVIVKRSSYNTYESNYLPEGSELMLNLQRVAWARLEGTDGDIFVRLGDHHDLIVHVLGED